MSSLDIPTPRAGCASEPVSPVELGILLPKDRASALAFLNGMLAAYDALNECRLPLRSDLLAVRQRYLDMPVEP